MDIPAFNRPSYVYIDYLQDPVKPAFGGEQIGQNQYIGD
jgi:hypothetical protein